MPSQRRADAPPSPAPRCAVLGTLDVLHDLWTLAILRSIFYGARRYGDIHDQLGISTNVLADRLELMVDRGLLDRVPYQQRPVRYDYIPTHKGAALADVIVALRDWGAEHLELAQPLQPLRHASCNGEVHAGATCSVCHRHVAWDEVSASPQTATR